MSSTTARLALARPTAIGLLDQAVSSLTNVLAVVVPARHLSQQAVGSLSIVLTVYAVINGVGRACSGELLSVNYARRGQASIISATERAAGVMLLVGIGGGFGVAVAGLVVGGGTGRCLLALAAALPLLLPQDAIRFGMLVSRSPGAALLNDLTWLVGFLIAYVLSADFSSSAPVAVLAWGLAGSLAGLLAMFQMRLTPKPFRCIGWVKRQGTVARRFVSEFLVTSSSVYLSTLMLLVFADLKAVASLRVAQTVMGPLNTLIQGSMILMIPALVRLNSPSAVVRRARTLAVVLVIVAGMWAVAATLMPTALGTELFGASWASSRNVVTVMTVSYVGIVAVFPAIAAARALDASDLSVRIRVAQLPIVLVATAAGAYLKGATGAAAGLAASSLLFAPIWWVLIVKRSRLRPLPSLARLR